VLVRIVPAATVPAKGLKHWIWVGEDDDLVLISVFPGEAGGADLYVTPAVAEEYAKRLEGVARRVRHAFSFASESSDDTDTRKDVDIG
jgi:hypothetical protein